jgi:hypothetical protein
MLVFHLSLSCIFHNWRLSTGVFPPEIASSPAAGVPVIASEVPQPQYDSMEIKFLHSELDNLKATIANIGGKIDDVNATLHEVIIDGGKNNDRSNAKVARSEYGVPVHKVPVQHPTNPPSSSSSSASSSQSAYVEVISIMTTILSVIGILVSAMAIPVCCYFIYLGAEEYLNKSTIWGFPFLGAAMGLLTILLTGSFSLDQVLLTQLWGMVIGLELGVACTAIETAVAAASL